MESRQPPFALEAPRFCCFPVRPLLILTSALGVLGGLSACINQHSQYYRISPGILVLLDLLILFGAFYNDEKALRWSRRIVIFSIWFAIVNFSIWPVLISSWLAAGTHYNATADGNFMVFETQSLDASHSRQNVFVIALLMGYFVELLIGFIIGKFYIQYILLNRLWKYVEATTIPSQQNSFDNPNTTYPHIY